MMDAKSAQGPLPRRLAARDHATRPFIAWDGEGWTDEDGRHHYMLFGASTGDTVSSYSLSTVQCLDLLLQVERDNPEAFHVIFAGNYDVNMILRDVSLDALSRLKTFGKCKWNGYNLEYRKSKTFRVSRDGVTITVYDVFTFFQTSFVSALETWIGSDDEDVRRIIHGKSLRSSFTINDLTEVRAYFEAELRYLVRLSNRLRVLLLRAGIRLHRWHGPGAIATALLKSQGFRRIDTPWEVSTAAQYAYAGGRFEPFRLGRHHGRVFQADIRSAYPHAITRLPSLHGRWQHYDGDNISTVHSYAMYRITYHVDASAQPSYIPHPFHWRAGNGAVFFPHHVTGWYWGVELKPVLRRFPERLTIHEGLVFHPSDPDARPFRGVADEYELRARWKREGEPAQLALKLGLNSRYGKLAQQMGWRITKDGVIKVPTYHQLEHAGFVTASTRSRIWDACMSKPDAIIAVETDGVFSTEPLDLNYGDGLGQWELKEYDGIMYIQSGVYFTLDGDTWSTKSRGFGRTDVEPEDVADWLYQIRDAHQAYHVPPLEIQQTRFKTLGVAIGRPEWRTWVDETRELTCGLAGGKREHDFSLCGQCMTFSGSMGHRLHETAVALDLPGVDYWQPSTPYPLAWLGQRPLEAAEEMKRIDDEVELWEVYS